MNTEYVKLDRLGTVERKEAFERAGQIIRDGGLVAFPTETVYGLGADALNDKAANRIYEAKGRPSDNPLIVHIYKISQVHEAAAEVSRKAEQLMEAFWPGPLTIILPKKAAVPDATTGGLSTVAIRMPSNPEARDLIRASGRLIAAPSANLSGRPSPTTAEHVYEDMEGRIPMILDGGPVTIGIESTIVDMSGDTPMILRPGYITKKMLEDRIGPVLVDPVVAAREKPEGVVAKAPGMKYRHYAPKGDLVLVEGPAERVTAKIRELVHRSRQEGYKTGVIATAETAPFYEADVVLSLGSRQEPEEAAASLYRILREMDDQGCGYIYSESIFSDGLGNAVMNRMLKAAGYHLIQA